MDQASFLGLQALRRGLCIHFTWHYPHALDAGKVNQFNEQLGRGLLGRRIQKSPLPWGRHRWVANPVPAPVTWFSDPLPSAQIPTWRSELINLPIDPEAGPGWRIAVQPIEGGGSVLSLLISHTLADGKAGVEAIAEALAGQQLNPAFSTAVWRWSPARILNDSLESLKAMPDVYRALKALVLKSRAAASSDLMNPMPMPKLKEARAPKLASLTNIEKNSDTPIEVPLVQVVMNAHEFDARASALEVANNTLLTAFATRLAFRMGRVNASGMVKLVLPVSDRLANDRRGNALKSVSLWADPEACMNNPQLLQRQMRSAMRSVLRQGDEMTSLLPLIPYVPVWLARHLEKMARGDGLPVGCSIVGELPSALVSPLGEATLLQFSALERLTPAVLKQMDGMLFLVCYSLGGRMLVTVSGYTPDKLSTKDELQKLVKQALSDLQINGSVN